jgi:hypothetical protein
LKVNSFGSIGGLQLPSSTAMHAVLNPQMLIPSLAVQESVRFMNMVFRTILNKQYQGEDEYRAYSKM